MKRILKSLCIAFSIYSKIPVPHFEWKQEDMKYHLIFFPLVGAVIGAAEWGWHKIFMLIGGIFPPDGRGLIFALLALAIPILITGGFHLDGFLDTMDALHSYGERGKKLAILEDPHVGAFAVISLALLMIFSLAGILALGAENEKSLLCVCVSFFISRCLSGISVVIFPKAKNAGMLFEESRAARIVCFILAVELLTAGFAEIVFFGFMGILVLGAMLAAFLYYFVMSKRNFGGITGDLAGFFVCVGEAVALVFACCWRG